MKPAAGGDPMRRTGRRRGQISKLAAAGGLGFWVANFAISLTPIAAEYRAALSIPYFPMLAEALVGGLAIGYAVAYLLLTFNERIPGKNTVLKSVALSTVILIGVTVLVEVPAKFLTPTNDAMRYFLIGTAFNIVRILALGVVIGVLHGRSNSRARA